MSATCEKGTICNLKFSPRFSQKTYVHEVFMKICVRQEQIREAARKNLPFYKLLLSSRKLSLTKVIFAEIENVQTNVTNFLAKMLSPKNEVSQNFFEICKISYFREIEKAFLFQP